MYAFLPTFLTTNAPPTKEATNHAKANTSSDLNLSDSTKLWCNWTLAASHLIKRYLLGKKISRKSDKKSTQNKHLTATTASTKSSSGRCQQWTLTANSPDNARNRKRNQNW